MTQARHFLVNAYNATAQPTDPVDGYSVHVAKTGALGAFADYPNYIAVYDSTIGWVYSYPRVGDRMTQNIGAEETFFFTPQAATPPSTWVRKSNMYSYKENDQNLTTAYVGIGDWEPAYPYTTTGTFGAFVWNTTNGELSLSRDIYGSLRMTWSFNVQQIASGNQNSFTVKIQKDAGGVGSWVDMDGGFGGGNTFSNASMFYDHVTICVQDPSASEDDAYRAVARCESDSADNLLTVADASVCCQEISPW